MIRKLLFRSFRLTSSVKYLFLTRLTHAGRLTLAGLIVFAVCGINVNINMAYQAFAFLFALLLISILAGIFFKSHLSFRRHLPRFGTVGQPISYHIELTNYHKRIRKELSIMEKLPDPRPTFEAFMQSREPQEDTRNPFDRAVGYHRWMWLSTLKKGAEVKEQRLPKMGPGVVEEARLELTPLQRGHLHLNGLKVSRSDPLGLFNSIDFVPLHGSILILPKRYPLPPFYLPGTRKHQPGGVGLASSVGDSEEFVSLREYRPGDPLRRIHWKSWAKTGKPIVKEYQEEFFVRHALILDTFHEIPGSEVFEEAVSLAASFVSTIKTHESLLDLMFVGPEAYCFTSGRGLAQIDRMLEILASVKVCRDKPFSTLFPIVTQRAGLLSSCICIMLKWEENRQRLVENLIKLGLPMIVLVVTARGVAKKLDPGPMKDQPHYFHQLEAGRIEEGLMKL